MFLLTAEEWRNKFIAYGITAVIGLIAYYVANRARRKIDKPSVDIKEVRRQAQIIGAVPVAVFGLGIVLLAGLLLLAHAPIWTFAIAIPFALWGLWWLPGGRRQTKSEASIFVQGLPSRVSAFVADVPGHVHWSPGVVSCTPDLQGPRGPRFKEVERGSDGKEYSGVLELTRDEPGVEVDLLLEGVPTGDYYTFAAQDGGTLVIKRTIIQLPYTLALAGGMFAVKDEAPAAKQRRINEVQALKTAFEAEQQS